MGTHMDAPAHFGKGKWRTQHIPIERLMGPGVIINIKNKAASNPDYQVVMEDIHVYESRYGRIKEGSIVLMYAGWYQKYPNKTAIFNTDHHNITSEFHFPGFHEDTVEWLIHHRRISAIGCDTPTFELPQTSSFPVHQIIGRENVIGIENAAYLDKIPEAGSTIFMPVIKIDDGSGGPVRLLATYEDGIDTPANGAETFFERSSLKFAFILIFVFKKITVFNC
ncbi:hypothetical protein FSP39_006075 [Pinctada imbricata]|uniref:Kynurenine formamidase n=1 Tax=Pinctada imbricata TaxID=66713 RepID=A0AA88YWY4_PINIB|nr:hypothetical protein FSP39_006075 [Pinctada imbricata]